MFMLPIAKYSLSLSLKKGKTDFAVRHLRRLSQRCPLLTCLAFCQLELKTNKTKLMGGFLFSGHCVYFLLTIGHLPQICLPSLSIAS